MAIWSLLVPVLLSWIRLSLPPPLGRTWGCDMFGRLELSRIGRANLRFALAGQPPLSFLSEGGVASWILEQLDGRYAFSLHSDAGGSPSSVSMAPARPNMGSGSVSMAIAARAAANVDVRRCSPM
jgi:hypothetical protein